MEHMLSSEFYSQNYYNNLLFLTNTRVHSSMLYVINIIVESCHIEGEALSDNSQPLLVVIGYGLYLRCERVPVCAFSSVVNINMNRHEMKYFSMNFNIIFIKCCLH